MGRDKPKLLGATIGLLTILAMGAAIAHHSGSRYDFARTVTLEGSVKEFQWTNPHVIIWVNVDRDNEDLPELWAIQLTSPGNLRRNGWSHRSLAVGDRVRIEAHPLRDGGTGGGLNKVTLLESGQVLFHFPPRSERE